MKIRVGFGFDVHKLVEGRELWLGGVRLEHELGLLGHSDADAGISCSGGKRTECRYASQPRQVSDGRVGGRRKV